MRDYLSAIDDAANNLPYVDKDRLGAVGASFGGFSVYFLAGHHDKRFSASLPMMVLSTFRVCTLIQKKLGSATGSMMMLTGTKTRAKQPKEHTQTVHILM